MTVRAKWIFVVLAVLVSAPLFAEDQIAWQADLAKALKQAREEKKIVLVHFYGDNCAPCRVVEQKVFPQPEVVQAVSRNYIPVKINVDKAERLAQHYNVRSWPTDVFLSPAGLELYRDTTRQSPADYVTILDQLAIQTGIGGARQASLHEREARNDLAAQPQQPAQQTPIQNQFVSQSPYVNRYVENGEASPAQRQGAGYPRQVAAGNNSANNAANNPAQPMANTSIYGNPAPQQPAQPQAGPYGSQTRPPPNQQTTWQDAGDITAPNPQSIRNQFVLVKDAPPVALDGYCSVTLKQAGKWIRGDKMFGAVHRGRTYLFASADEQSKFLADPDAYSPVLSGADPVIFAERGELVEGKRSLGVALPNGGRSEMYLFASPETRDRFEKNPRDYAVTAHQAMLRSETKLR